MVSILPNPVTRSARNPGPGVRRMAARYVARARSAPEIAACLGRLGGHAADRPDFGPNPGPERGAGLALPPAILYKRGSFPDFAARMRRDEGF